MRAYPDSSDDLDAAIVRALRAEAGGPIPAAQKRAAWERVRARAARQDQLPPLPPDSPLLIVDQAEPPPRETTKPRWLLRCLAWGRGAVTWLLVDEAAYQRARLHHAAPKAGRRLGLYGDFAPSAV